MMPSTRKIAPAARRIQMGGTTRATASPATTAMALVETRASAEPAKTIQREAVALPARESVASWVLSPISAMNTAANVDAKSFQSMGQSMPPDEAASTPYGAEKERRRSSAE